MTHRFVVTIEEHSIHGGLGMIVNHFLMKNDNGNIKVLNFGIPDVWVQFGSNEELLKELGLDAESIAYHISTWFNASSLTASVHER